MACTAFLRSRTINISIFNKGGLHAQYQNKPDRALSAAVLTACGGGGGGGGGDGTDARIKYVGIWIAPCSPTSPVGGMPRYEKEQIVIALQGTSNLAVTLTEILYLDSTCIQAATPGTGDTAEATLTFVGSTKTLADGKVVDKVQAALTDLNPGMTTVPAILYTADNKMYVQYNDPDEPPVPSDREGFPDTLDTNSYITKVTN